MHEHRNPTAPIRAKVPVSGSRTIASTTNDNTCYDIPSDICNSRDFCHKECAKESTYRSADKVYLGSYTRINYVPTITAHHNFGADKISAYIRCHHKKDTKEEYEYTHITQQSKGRSYADIAMLTFLALNRRHPQP